MWGITGEKPDDSAQVSPTTCRLIDDLERAIESREHTDFEIARSAIATIVLNAARSTTRLTTSPSYDFKTLRDVIVNAQAHYEDGDAEYPTTTGNLLKIKAAAMMIVALCRLLTPGRTLHELLLSVLREVLINEWPRINLQLTDSYSLDLYEAGLRNDLDAVFAILETRFLTAE